MMEMYYLADKKQAKIAKIVGVTRFMILHMLTEARESGIVEIRIHRPLRSDPELENALQETFGLKDVFVMPSIHRSGERLIHTLGECSCPSIEALSGAIHRCMLGGTTPIHEPHRLRLKTGELHQACCAKSG